MVEQHKPNIGKTPGDNSMRGTVNVVVDPVIAGGRLFAGLHVGIGADGRAYCDDVKLIGVVDPYFKGGWIHEGEIFWLFLYPSEEAKHD